MHLILIPDDFRTCNTNEVLKNFSKLLDTNTSIKIKSLNLLKRKSMIFHDKLMIKYKRENHDI